MLLQPPPHVCLHEPRPAGVAERDLPRPEVVAAVEQEIDCGPGGSAVGDGDESAAGRGRRDTLPPALPPQPVEAGGVGSRRYATVREPTQVSKLLARMRPRPPPTTDWGTPPIAVDGSNRPQCSTRSPGTFTSLTWQGIARSAVADRPCRPSGRWRSAGNQDRQPGDPEPLAT